MVVESELSVVQNLKVEAEDEADAKTKPENVAEEADELMCFDKSLQVSSNIIKYLHQCSNLNLCKQ